MLYFQSQRNKHHLCPGKCHPHSICDASYQRAHNQNTTALGWSKCMSANHVQTWFVLHHAMVQEHPQLIVISGTNLVSQCRVDKHHHTLM